MNLGRLRQRIYSPPPLTTRALPREPWNPSPKPGRFQPRPRLRADAREARRSSARGPGDTPSPAPRAGRPGEASKGSTKEAAGAVMGDDGPGLKKCDARPGEAARHGGLACHHGGRHGRGPVAALVMTCAFYPIYGPAQPLCGLSDRRAVVRIVQSSEAAGLGRPDTPRRPARTPP